MEPSDEELCRRVARHDAQAFELLVERHQARAYRLALSMLGNDADARDASQEAFIRLYQSADRFDERSRFTTWFHQLLVNLCIDQLRRGRWWRRLLSLSDSDDPDRAALDPPSEQPGPDAQALRSQLHGRLRAALDRLSPKQRAAVLLLVEEDYTSRQIAAVLRCSENTARVHLHRAVAQLKKTLGEN